MKAKRSAVSLSESWSRILVLMRKEIVQVLREPKILSFLFGPPLIQLVVFGYAVNLDVPNTKLGWMDRDRTPESRELLASFEGSNYFTVSRVAETEQQITDWLDRGVIHAVVRVPRGFARDLARGKQTSIQTLVDGTNSNTASIVSNYIRGVVAEHISQIPPPELEAFALDAGVPANRSAPEIEIESRVWFNPDLESQDYYLPGVVVNIIALVTVILTALAIVREKEIGTMEQLMVTPIRPLELMLGKTLPFAVIGILEVMMVTGAALLIFGIPFRGGPLILFVSSVLFLLTTLGAGLLISTVSNTQQQAMMGTFFFFLPAFMLSGFAFPIRNMPLVVQYLTYLNPIRYFLEIARGVFLKGTGFSVLWPQMLGLFLFGSAMLLLSAARFRKRVD